MRLILVLVLANIAVGAVFGLAAAEESGSRIIVLPLRGPGGVVARNEIANAIEPNVSYVQRIGAKGAQRPARTARMHKADAMLSGRVRCPSAACFIDVMVYRRSGQLWTKGRVRSNRGSIGADAADLATKLLDEAGLTGVVEEEPIEEEIDEEEFQPVSDVEVEEEDSDEFDIDSFGDEEEERPSRSGEREFDALEVYFNADLTVLRNLCLDLNPEMENNIGCNLDNPAEDDRTYTVTPFANLGFKLAVFPGAFARRTQWWSHLGLYLSYGHSISVSSQREYVREGTNELFEQQIGTSQQDLRVALMYRLAFPFDNADGPQLRFMVGFGWYEFALDDSDYPQNNEITRGYRDSNPYLPTFAYTSFDFGLHFRMPIRSFIFPYTTIQYRAGMSSGQAERVYGHESSINGVLWDLGVAIELGVGIRLIAGLELIWYQTKFAGEFRPESEEEAYIWGVNSDTLGDTSTDLVMRLNLGIGWSF